MTINKKFKVGESAYILFGNEIREVKVGLIKIMVEGNEEHVDIYYSVYAPNKDNSWVNEKELYKTKKEAMHELIRQMGFDVSENDLKEI